MRSRIILQITLICDSGFAVGDVLIEEGWHYWMHNPLLGYWNHSLWSPAKFKDCGHSAASYSSAFLLMVHAPPLLGHERLPV